MRCVHPHSRWRIQYKAAAMHTKSAIEFHNGLLSRVSPRSTRRWLGLFSLSAAAGEGVAEAIANSDFYTSLRNIALDLVLLI
jgi:hypothetical protein